MKAITTRKICILFTFIAILGIHATINSQNWVEQHSNILIRNWELNFNAGSSSYFGDLSVHDNNISGKFTHESGLAFGVILTKQLAPELGISCQLLKGELRGANRNIQFSSSIYEYNIHMRLNLVRMMSTDNLKRFKLEAYAGIGNFVFNSSKIETLEGETILSEHNARVPEFVYFMGSRISYQVSENISLGLDMSVHQFQNDKIDITVLNGDFDYFTYF